MSEQIERIKGTTIVKGTAITTAVLLMIVLQITVFRAVGDIVSSLVIFAAGYLAGKLSKS